MTEAELIARIASAFGGLVAEGAAGFLDDGARLPPPSESGGRSATRVVTADQLIEGRHFRRDIGNAADAGWRAIARNVSDLAALGAKPVGFVWTLALPAAWTESIADLDELFAGAAECAGRYGLLLYGGDVARTDGPLVCSVTAFGDAEVPFSRRGARAGHALFLSRRVGGAAAGLAHLVAGGDRSSPAARLHLRPEPEVELVSSLAGCSACIDVSDGLLADLSRLVRASGVGAHLDQLMASVAPEAGEGELALERALGGGDDYALLFTLPAPEALRGPATRAVRIGWITDEPGIRGPGGEVLAPRGYDHFGSGGELR